MDIRFNASGRMVWDVATAVAWRLDPDRPRLSEGAEEEAVEHVFVQHVEDVATPPRLRQHLDQLRLTFPDAVPDVMQFVVSEHIYAALSSEISADVQDPNKAPFLRIGEAATEVSILVDIGLMLREYQEAMSRLDDWARRQEEMMKKVIRNSVTPRFDRLDVKLEEVSRKIDAGFQNAATTNNERFDELVKEIRKVQPRPPSP